MNLRLLLAITITLLVLDLLWLGVVAKSFYSKELGSQLKSPPNRTGAILVYLLLVVGIYLFVFGNGLATSRISIVFLGAVFGLIVYGVYEFTNLALVNGWPLKVVIVDIIWGIFLSGFASIVGSYFR